MHSTDIDSNLRKRKTPGYPLDLYPNPSASLSGSAE